MNNVNIIKLNNERIEHLKKYGIDVETIGEYKSKIKSNSKSEELSKELFLLIKSKDFNEKENIEKMTELIINGADVDYHDEAKGDFPLLICCKKGYVGTFILLLKFGADVNNKNNYGTTATMAAARHGYDELLKILIYKNADIDARCIDGDNALDSAKIHHELDCIRILKNASCITSSYECKIETTEEIITHEKALAKIEEAYTKLQNLMKKQNISDDSSKEETKSFGFKRIR